jgi:prolyl-tRNA editing enzyme YbaK/EbsC (Cys-tRNA(Pro) deacylase)
LSLDSVRDHLAAIAPDISIIHHELSTATVQDAALAHKCEPGQIAKTLSLRLGDKVVLLVAKGDARLDNKKAKAALGAKPRMLGAEEVEAITGHPVGGVTPFGLASELPVYLDVSLKAYEEVIPAAGNRNSSLRIAPDRLAALLNATWVDACE